MHSFRVIVSQILSQQFLRYENLYSCGSVVVNPLYRETRRFGGVPWATVAKIMDLDVHIGSFLGGSVSCGKGKRGH